MGNRTQVPCAFPPIGLAHHLSEFAKGDPRTEYLEADLVGPARQGRQLFLFCGRLPSLLFFLDLDGLVFCEALQLMATKEVK
jgi:hypothetical protein